MAAWKELIEEKMKEIDLNKIIPIKNDDIKKELPLEDSYMIDLIEQLNENETDVDNISKVTHQFLLAATIKNATKILNECIEDGKVQLDNEQMNFVTVKA